MRYSPTEVKHEHENQRYKGEEFLTPTLHPRTKFPHGPVETFVDGRHDDTTRRQQRHHQDDSDDGKTTVEDFTVLCLWVDISVTYGG